MRRHALEVLLWWGLAYGVWLISLSAISTPEYIVGALCALPCGVAAAGARWAVEGSWTLRPGWLLPLTTVPLAVVCDAAQVLAAPWHRGQPGGDFHTGMTAAKGSSPVGKSRQAIAVALVSLTPGSYVLDVDPESGEMLVHSLARRGPRLERMVSG